jgi:sugar diacid utilization regulator
MGKQEPSQSLPEQPPHREEARLAVVLDAMRALAGTSDVDELVAGIAEQARRLLDADLAFVGLLGDDCDCAYVRAISGSTDVLTVGQRLGPDAGLDRAMLVESAGYWKPDYLADDQVWRCRVLEDVYRADGLRAAIAVPLTYDGRACGVLNVGVREIRHFTADERAVISIFGDIAGAAIGTARRLTDTAAEVAGLRTRSAAIEAQLGDTLRRVNDHRELVDLVLGGGDLQALVVDAAHRLNGAAQVCAPDGTVLAKAGEAAHDPQLSTVVAVENTQGGGEPQLLTRGVWTAPIVAGNENLGALILRPYGTPGARAESLRLVAQAAAIVLLRRSTGDVADSQARDDLLDDLLIDTRRAPQELDRRARRLGVELTRPHVVVVAQPEGQVQGRTVVWASSYAQRLGGLKTMHDGYVVLLLPGTDASRAARTVRDELSASFGQVVTVGAAGPTTGGRPVRDIYREARRCLDAITALGGAGGAASASDLGFVGILLSNNHDIHGFIDSVLEPVLNYDRQRSAELARTLEVYFAVGSRPTHAAERLHVHPNTVARRLERIKELLGADWQEPERAFDIQVALRLQRIRRTI